MSPPGEGEELALNGAVRMAVARAITGQSSVLESCSTALAFAAHPWPDRTVPGSVLEVIAAEMSTSRTLPHHDPRELAQDRLLRIAEALDELVATSSNIRESCGDLPSIFWGVASKLDSDIQAFPLVGSKVEEHMRPVSSLVGNTTGLNSGSPNPGAGSTTRLANPDAGDAPVISHADGLGFASALVVAYVRTGHDDLGQILGESETGSSVLRFVELFGLGPYLLPGHDEFLQTLTDRELTILNQRFAFPGERRTSLREIGEQVGVTGERVRTIEKRSLNRLSLLHRTNSGVFDQLAHQVHLTERLITAAKVLTAGSAQPELLPWLLLKLEADWATEGDYSIGDQVADQFASLKDRLAERADENLLLTEEVVEEVVGDLFTSESTRDTVLTERGLIRIYGFWALRDNHQTRIAAALRTIGRSATKAEIGELAGLTESQISAQASLTPGVVRADMTRWGFEEWIDDVYDGIVGEIEQRIDEHGGSVSLSLLIEELKRFGAEESSIRTYAKTERFNLENGIVSRNEAAYRPRPPHQRSGAARVDQTEDGSGGGWGQRVSLDDRHFNGYSLKVGFDLAFANGVRPDDSLLVPVLGHEPCEASVIWRTHEVTRSVDVGRISGLLSELGHEAGDQLVVVAARDFVRLVRGAEIPATVHEPDVEEAVTGELNDDSTAPGTRGGGPASEERTTTRTGWDVQTVVIRPETSDR
jgi:hypothetical protein